MVSARATGGSSGRVKTTVYSPVGRLMSRGVTPDWSTRSLAGEEISKGRPGVVEVRLAVPIARSRATSMFRVWPLTISTVVSFVI